MYNRLLMLYLAGKATREQILAAEAKGWITHEQAEAIFAAKED